jgi:hypothetical protein
MSDRGSTRWRPIPWRALLAATWPPLLVWLGATAVTLASCALEGRAPFSPLGTWSRWDSQLYLSVAHGGYTLTPCLPRSSGAWCGNAGWFPGYPWLVGGLNRLGLPLAATALAVSWLAWLGALILLWKVFLSGSGRRGAGIGMLYAGFAPGLVYDYAVAPLGLLALCVLASFALLVRGHRVAAGLAAGVAALVYPIGIVTALAAVSWVAVDQATPRRLRPRSMLAVGLPTVAALALFALDQRLETGRWDAYLLVQRKYGHGLQDPFGTVASAWRVVARSPFALASTPALQTLLVVVALACVLVDLAARPSALSRSDMLLASFALAAWLLPRASAHVSVYRADATLVPLAVLVARLPRPLAALFCLAAILLAVPIETLYWRNLLV